MVILGLDLSIKPGWAVLDETGELVDCGAKIFKTIGSSDDYISDFTQIDRAWLVGNFVDDLIKKFKPDFIWIEQTNAGSWRNSQKLLEFIHFAVLSKIKDYGLKERVRYVDTSAWTSSNKIRMTKEDSAHNKLVKEKKARGKITKKHLSVRWASERFNLKLKLLDNDMAEALAIAMHGVKKNQEKLKEVNKVSVKEALGL